MARLRSYVVRRAYLVYGDEKVASIVEKIGGSKTLWVLRPDYYKLSRLPDPLISGIDLSLKCREYVTDYVPAYVEERTLPDDRDGLDAELALYGLETNDRFEYMCRSGGKCTKNNYRIIRG